MIGSLPLPVLTRLFEMPYTKQRDSAATRPAETFLVLVILMAAAVSASSQTPSPSPSASAVTPPAASSSAIPVNPLTLDDALRLANAQASTYQSAILNERIASEDVRQAQAAFKPKVSAPLEYIYTSPAIGLPPGEPRTQSFIANNAIGEYLAMGSVSGDLDIAGKLRATLAKNRALLAAAHAGTEVAKRALAQAVIEAYYGLALAAAQHRAADENLAAAQEFERITALLLSGGEVAQVDLTRAQLQTLARRNEVENARVNEDVAASSLRVLIGYDLERPVATTELALALPTDSEYQKFKADEVTRRPEFTQLEQQLRAARQEIKIARADRLPALSYSINGGFDTDSLRGPRLKEHTGMSAQVGLTIPIFDWGATKSRERQASLRVQIAENERTMAVKGFGQQFYAARAQAAGAAARVALAREGVTKAQDNLTASIARYRAGEAQIVEVTDAQTTLVTQRSALSQAIFDYQIALSRLRQATGQ
ncbi:MAG TPA: TolC family protein [Pyrinomonadaceae bacterium]|nr:TolC family protein [Pyrinomonadaceae bacterium]